MDRSIQQVAGTMAELNIECLLQHLMTARVHTLCWVHRFPNAINANKVQGIKSRKSKD